MKLKYGFMIFQNGTGNFSSCGWHEEQPDGSIVWDSTMEAPEFLQYPGLPLAEVEEVAKQQKVKLFHK